jgi:ABC-type iron transport system FetAB ATPase subunit
VLRVEQLRVRHLPPLSFSVAAGECLAVEGPSGAGKTLLLRALADLDPAPGYVYLEALERREISAPRWRRQVCYVAAEPAWWAETAGEHMRPSERLDRMLSALNMPAALIERPLSMLSTGERQRLAIVRALLVEPKVILMDEPTAALDAKAAALVEELIRFQMLAGRCVLLVSHDTGQIARLADARLLLGPNAMRERGAAA